MTGNRGRFANSNGGKYTGPLSKISLEHKVLLFFNKITGQFLGRHIWLVIEAAVKSRTREPISVAHSGWESPRPSQDGGLPSDEYWIHAPLS